MKAGFLFRGAEETASRALSDSRCRLVSAEKGTVISDVYDYRQNLGVILSGAISVTKPTSRRYTMNTLARGGVFGAADLFDEGGGRVTVLTAAKNCRLVFFPLTLLEELMRDNYRIADNYIRFLTGRLRFLNEKIESLVVEGAEASLAHYLALRAAAEMPEADGSRVVRVGSVSKLAEELHIGRASLYRALKVLEDGGLIRQNGREIVVLDEKKLSGMVNDREETL